MSENDISKPWKKHEKTWKIDVFSSIFQVLTHFSTSWHDFYKNTLILRLFLTLTYGQIWQNFNIFKDPPKNDPKMGQKQPFLAIFDHFVPIYTLFVHFGKLNIGLIMKNTPFLTHFWPIFWPLFSWFFHLL